MRLLFTTLFFCGISAAMLPNDQARVHMNFFNSLILDLNTTRFFENVAVPYTIEWCDKKFNLYKEEILAKNYADREFDYPLGYENMMGLPVTAYDAVELGDTLEYETRGFNLHTIFTVRWENGGYKFVGERRLRCTKALWR